MGFSIVDGISDLGAIAIVLLISAGAIALVFFIASARAARRDALDEDPDHTLPKY